MGRNPKRQRVELPDGDRRRLEGITKDRQSIRKYVWRVWIILDLGSGRSAAGRIPIAGAGEMSEEGKPCRIRLATVGDFGGATLRDFNAGAVALGAWAVTDGWSGYTGLPNSHSVSGSRCWRQVDGRSTAHRSAGHERTL